MAATLVEQSYEVVPVGRLKQHPKNPNKGNVGVIAESIEQNGFYGACVAQKSTGRILAGNHRWAGAKQAGAKTIPVIWLDVDDETALRIMLVDNRSSDLSTTDAELLAEVLKALPDVAGTGYTQDDYDALMGAIESTDVGSLDELISGGPRFTLGDDDEDDIEPGADKPPGIEEFEAGDDKELAFDDVSSDLQGALTLKQDMDLRGKSNYYDIPDLKRSMLLDKMPEPFDTWAGQDATPDDGQTTWLYNYGLAGFKGLPCDRAVLAFFTYDEKFAGWWEYPGFYTAKLMNAGIRYACVPDYSFYDEFSTAMMIWNTFRAQWLGRYFQEAGLKVIPRLQFSIDKDRGEKTLDFCMAGIPKNPPILIQSIQNDNDDNQSRSIEMTKKCLEVLQPDTWVVYGGKPAERVMNTINYPNCKWLPNYVHKRRGVVFDKKEGLAADPEKRKAVNKARRVAKKAKGLAS